MSRRSLLAAIGAGGALLAVPGCRAALLLAIAGGERWVSCWVRSATRAYGHSSAAP